VSYDAGYGKLPGGVTGRDDNAAGLSRDGRFVAFATSSPIAATDVNAGVDVYLVQLRP
jgi:hypothetical protein